MGDDIFTSLREGYPRFDQWWHEKCIKQHRLCWIITIDGELAGLVVRKDELHEEAQTAHLGPKIMKVCTFKVKPKFRGEKLGELLLKQILWYAQRNVYDLVYLTTFSDQTFLIQVLEYYGFQCTLKNPIGEMVYEKPMSREPLRANATDDIFLIDRLNYPRFVNDKTVQTFFVPIRGSYHQKLFPEIAKLTPLPLFFGESDFISPSGSNRTPGNTIRKVYLCRAKSTSIKSGDVLLFYQSKSPSFVASQTITTIGIVERITTTKDFEQLIRITAKRSVYSESELKAMVEEGPDPVKVIDFILIGHIEPPIPLKDLIDTGTFSDHPPQSITIA